MSAVVEKLPPNGQPEPLEPTKKAVSRLDEQAFEHAAENPDETPEGDELSVIGDVPINLSQKAVVDDDDTKPPPKFDLDEDKYDDALNSIVHEMVDSVDGRSLQGITRGDNAKHYQYMIEYKLHEQAKNGKNVSLDKAYMEVEEAIRGRYGLAADNYDNKNHRLDVLEGYWERQKGREQAKDLAVGAYQKYWNKYGPPADEGSYDDKLNTLASGMIGGVVEKHHNRILAIGLANNDKVKELYKNLVKDKLADQGAPFNLDRAHREVMEDLRARMKTAAGNTEHRSDKLLDVMDGYWEDQTGEADAKSLARTAYEEFQDEYEPTDEDTTQIKGDSKYEDELNAVAATLADGIDADTGRVPHFTDGDIRDHYGNLIYLKLQEQKKAGDGISLDKAYDDVRNDLTERMPHALRDHDDPGGAKKAYDKYWKDGDGRGDAGKVARDAYGKFLQENTLLDNPDYEDNLNALTTSMGDGVIDDTRTLSGLRGGVPKELYKNLITHKLDEGKSLDEATDEVVSELEERVKAAYSGDTEDIVLGYFSRRDGKDAAKDAASEAYAEYIGSRDDRSPGAGSPDKPRGDGGEDDLLPPVATDIMNAETVDGTTVSDVFVGKIIDEYENSDQEYKREFAELVRLKAAIAGGFEIMPYQVRPNGGSGGAGDITDYADNMHVMDPRIMRDLVDVETLDAKIAEMVEKHDDLRTDQDAFLKASVMRIKDKKTLTDRIYATMTSPAYEEMLKNAQSEDGDTEALARYASDIRSLELLDPDLAAEVQSKLVDGAAFGAFDDLFEKGPDAFDEEAVGMAAKDVAYAIVRGSVLGGYATTGALDLRAFFDGKIQLDPLGFSPEERARYESAKKEYQRLHKLFTDSWKDIKVDRGTSPYGKDWIKQYKLQLEKNISKSTPLMKDLNNRGILGVGAGMMCLVAGAMGLSMNGYENTTPEQRMGSAFYLLWTSSNIPDAFRKGGVLETLLRQPGMADAIGMDKTPGSILWDDSKKVDADANKKIWQPAQDNVKDKLGKAAVNEYNSLPSDVKKNILNEAKRKLGDAGKNLSDIDKIKLIGPGLKVLGNLAYGAGSVLGIYLGVDALKNADTPLEKAGAAMAIGSGAAWTAGAGAGFASLFGAGTGAAIAGSVLGGIALAMAVVGFGIGLALRNKVQEDKADEVRDYFNQFASMDLLKDDWGHKLDYTIHLMYEFESKPTPKNPSDEWYRYYFPEDMMPWEAQPEHFERFLEYQASGETPSGSFWHIDYADPAFVGHGDEPDGPRWV